MRDPWLSAPVLGLLGAALVFGVAFAVRLATAAEPLIPTAVLGNRVVACATLAACFAMGTFIGLTIYVPISSRAWSGSARANPVLPWCR